ncbi:MAG: AEC family transporter [Rubrobacteraceae bacterium]
MSEVALLFICLAAGWILRSSGVLGGEGTQNLSAWVINVALPATAIVHIHKVEDYGVHWLVAAATPWLGVALAWVIFSLMARWLEWSRQTLGALVLVGGFGNTSFVGIPMVWAYFGREWTSLVLVIDIFGSYLALSTLGIALASWHGAESVTLREVVKRIAFFPPFIAVVIALILSDFSRPEWIDAVLTPIAETLTPIAMAAVGSALRFHTIPANWRQICLGLGHRLFVAPALIVVFYLVIGSLGSGVATITIFEAAMPPMLGASVIAIRFGLRPDLVAGMIGLGIPLSMVTLPVWAWALG